MAARPRAAHPRPPASIPPVHRGIPGTQKRGTPRRSCAPGPAASVPRAHTPSRAGRTSTPSYSRRRRHPSRTPPRGRWARPRPPLPCWGQRERTLRGPPARSAATPTPSRALGCSRRGSGPPPRWRPGSNPGTDSNALLPGLAHVTSEPPRRAETRRARASQPTSAHASQASRTQSRPPPPPPPRRGRERRARTRPVQQAAGRGGASRAAGHAHRGPRADRELRRAAGRPLPAPRGPWREGGRAAAVAPGPLRPRALLAWRLFPPAPRGFRGGSGARRRGGWRRRSRGSPRGRHCSSEHWAPLGAPRPSLRGRGWAPGWDGDKEPRLGVEPGL